MGLVCQLKSDGYILFFRRDEHGKRDKRVIYFWIIWFKYCWTYQLSS